MGHYLKRRNKVVLFLMSLLLVAGTLAGCAGKEEKNHITLMEVAHSIFYAPMYVAIEKGYFEEEGLEVELVNGLGADKTMTALLAGECDIGFMGSESSIYVYAQGEKDYAVNFAQLTQRAGNFLVARQPQENFTWEQLKGKTVLGGRTGGMPQNNVNPASIIIITNTSYFQNPVVHERSYQQKLHYLQCDTS